MKFKLTVLMAAAILLMAFTIASADKESGISGKLYAHWYTDLSDTLNYSISDVDFDSYSAFGITRSYLTGWANLTEKTSGRITADMNPGNNNIRLKYAYLKWKLYSGPQIDLAAKFGLHQTPWIYGMNKMWGRRYLAMTPSDELGMLSSSDNGISLIGKLGEKAKWGWASLSVFNGASFDSPMDNNPNKDINLAAFITPISDNPDMGNSTVGFQYYKGTLNAYNDSSQTEDDYKKTILSAVANFQYKKLFALGVEYDSYNSSIILGTGNNMWQDTLGNVVENKATALALFGTLWFEELLKDNDMVKSLNLFFRYTMYDPDGDDIWSQFDPDDKTKYSEMIIGAECAPYKGLKTSLNYRSESAKDLGTNVDDISNSYLFLNAQFAF